VGTVCIASILWYAGVRHHDVSFALVVTFTQYIKQFFEPVSLLAQRYTILQSAMSGAERIFKLLDEKEIDPEPIPAEKAGPSGPEDEAIGLADVTFWYKPNVPVLRDVSLSVKKGERVALVGATGAGKTTLASLASRLYHAPE